MFLSWHLCAMFYACDLVERHYKRWTIDASVDREESYTPDYNLWTYQEKVLRKGIVVSLMRF